MSTFPHLEFHRLGIGLVPAPGGSPDATAIHIASPGGGRPLRSCICPESRLKTCRHLKRLSASLRAVRETYGAGGWEPHFHASVWYKLARILQEALPQPFRGVRIAQIDEGFVVSTPRGQELARYLDDSPVRVHFLERLGKVPKDGRYADRAGLIERLSLFQMKDIEREMARRGVMTARQAWEESFWYRLAYHCVRELEKDAGTFHPAIDLESGDFTLLVRRKKRAFCQITVPRKRVETVLKLLAEAYPDQDDLAVHPVPLRSLFQVSQTTELDLEVRPVIEALQEDGEARFFARDDLEKFRYGRLVYVPELGILAELERDGRERKFKAPKAMTLKLGQVPTFLQTYGDAVREGKLVLDEPLRGLEVFTDFEWVEMDADPEDVPAEDALGRSWYWLSVRYGFGNQTISLQEILEARRRGLPYLETTGGWIDLRSDAFEGLERLVPSAEDGGDDGRIRLTAGEVLRLRAAADKPVRLGGGERAAVLERVLELRPLAPFEQPRGFVSDLRPYQVLGVDWLRFLYENRLAGLLCDDMGLGKTHQAMALMASLRQHHAIDAPFLVVCPTTVIPHWRDKIREYAPGLHAVVYHGLDRDLDQALSEGDTVLVTSYGILRNDLDRLAEIPFALAVFDEIQYLKNRGTRSYQSAVRLDAEVKIGLTGTPIENSLDELKALFDLVLPGYLGSDDAFQRRYVKSNGDGGNGAGGRIEELRRLISPFVLRRTKTAVLSELPEKIEDVRACDLSDDQVKLYRDALSTRGRALAERIRAEPSLPYIHIFALLNHLKQICDHPALALRELDDADVYSSGKWDLYREILRECLDSGLKVVVFTQYLGMIDLMSRHLRDRGVEFVTLTGASTHRGAIVDRFNKDDDCRVFLGSLKAGGTGIDLVGGSVVIHYDRWWNAAREDQATDRVHRIGQKRAVQVFKLVTEGTLEEKIGAIIDKKRELMESVVQEDDPKLSKIFSREELLELLEEG